MTAQHICVTVHRPQFECGLARYAVHADGCRPDDSWMRLASMAHRGVHEFNAGFEWRRPDGPFRRITDEQVDSYCEQGFFVIPNAYDADEVDRMAAEIDPIQARINATLERRTSGDRPGFTIASNLVLRSPVLRQFCATGVLPDVARDLLGPRVRLFWEQAVYKRPEHSQAFAWHQDNGKVFVEPQQYITCWVALTDATEQNGCLSVAPGLHRLGTLRHWQSEQGWVCLDEDPADAVPVPLSAGDMAIFSSVTTHMTYPNRSDSTRKAYVVQYIPDGAVAVDRGDDGGTATTPQDLDDRQFLVG
ncbi:hypothetical protein C6361_24015 [Plantactinospora sp. BC1]|nr:hypothetical protein C6361_24015 [Plantactinospora sp. BC1]